MDEIKIEELKLEEGKEDLVQKEEESQAKRIDPFSYIIKRTLVVLLVVLGGFFLWAAFAPLTKGSAAPGLVTVATYRKPVQHPYGGTVREILVKDGDHVSEGQILIRLEDSQAKAQFAKYRSEYYQALATRYRLLAERILSKTVNYPSEILSLAKEDFQLAQFLRLQEALLRARLEDLESKKRGILDIIRSLEETKEKLIEQKKVYLNKLEILKSQIEALKEPTEAGYYPRNRYLELLRTYEDTQAELLNVEANLRRTETSIKDYQLRLKTTETEFFQQVEAELSKVEENLAALRDQYEAALDVLQKTEVKAPYPGIVMNLKVRSVGEVIKAGETILEIIPKDAELIVEARVNPNDIEDVKPGLKADLRFTALNPRKTPVFEGTVIYVSPDIQFDEIHRIYYYLARIKIDEESLKEIQKFKYEIKPGMPVTVIIKSGHRTFLSYLFKSFMDRLSTAFLK